MFVMLLCVLVPSVVKPFVRSTLTTCLNHRALAWPCRPFAPSRSSPQVRTRVLPRTEKNRDDRERRHRARHQGAPCRRRRAWKAAPRIGHHDARRQPAGVTLPTDARHGEAEKRVDGEQRHEATELLLAHRRLARQVADVEPDAEDAEDGAGGTDQRRCSDQRESTPRHRPRRPRPCTSLRTPPSRAAVRAAVRTAAARTC